MTQYDNISKEYTNFAKIDPIKKYAQYPEAIRILGNVKDKKVLDVGCGSGLLTIQLVKKGAKIIGYDISAGQIELAKKDEEKNKLGIKYFVADPTNIEEILKRNFKKTPLFDKASSTLVLHYAKDREHLTQFFRSTFNLLKQEGSFHSIFTNPDYKKMGKPAYNRFFKRVDEKIKFDFLDSEGNVKVSAYFSDFSRKDYEMAVRKAGFKSFRWVKLKVNSEGVKEMGKEFWKGYEEDCPYVGLIAIKK